MYLVWLDLNVSSGLGFKGTCKHCGVAMARIAAGFCDGNGVVITNIFLVWQKALLGWPIPGCK